MGFCTCNLKVTKAVGSSHSGGIFFPFYFSSCVLPFSVFFFLRLSFAIYMNWIYGMIYVKTDFIFKSFYDTYGKHRKEITWSLLRFWTFFIGGWIRFGVTVRVCHNKMALWAKQPRGGDSAARILRMLIRPPANFRQSFAYFWAILYEPFLKNRDFFWYSEIFLSIRGDFWGASSGFGRLGQNPAGAIIIIISLVQENFYFRHYL